MNQEKMRKIHKVLNSNIFNIILYLLSAGCLIYIVSISDNNTFCAEKRPVNEYTDKYYKVKCPKEIYDTKNNKI